MDCNLRLWLIPIRDQFKRTSPRPLIILGTNIIHGGVLATVLDEVMVWCAIWASRRACVAAELSLRFLQKASIGEPLHALASVTRERSRLIETTAEFRDASGQICIATGKYVPLGIAETTEFLKTFVEAPSTAEAASRFRLLKE